jgi:tRNA(Ile)-lysidine synthase
MPMEKPTAVSATEAKSLFSDLDRLPALVLAVSGGPDSTALMVLAARWRKSLKVKPKLIAVTIDHGLRAESKREAAAVGRLTRKLGLAHRILRWAGKKPKTGLQEAARAARYRLLANVAHQAKASHILTAHTLDDQAETVLIRMSRGSGVKGLAAMARQSRLDGLILLRPFLGIEKARLVATLRAAKINYAEDPSNRDPRFTRARLRGLMPALAREGLDARRLSLLAARLRRADRAIEATVDRAETELALPSAAPGAIVFDAKAYSHLPAEIALRLIGRAVAKVGDEGPVELGKLEALKASLDAAQNAGQKAGNARFRRSLAGALVTLAGRQITVERAPPRRERALTKPGRGRAKLAISR